MLAENHHEDEEYMSDWDQSSRPDGEGLNDQRSISSEGIEDEFNRKLKEQEDKFQEEKRKKEDPYRNFLM